MVETSKALDGGSVSPGSTCQGSKRGRHIVVKQQSEYINASTVANDAECPLYIS